MHGSFPLLLTETRRNFSRIFTVGTWFSSWRQVSQYHARSLWLGPSGVFNSQMCPSWASSNSSIIAQVLLPGHRLPWRFLLVSVSTPVRCNSVRLLASQSYRQRFTLCYTLSHGSKRVVDFFQSVWLFTCCWHGVDTSKLPTYGTRKWNQYFFFG